MTEKTTKHKFPYKWNIKDGYPAKGINYHGSTVFSCFACGGGSTMGYKLAGYNVIGCNEIDSRMMACYVANHNPKFSFLQPIQEFKNRKDLPKELYNLDILDGSPPCSSFSMAGSREDDWGKEKKFREGQSKQVLDTLFFDFIELAKELKPKVVVAENVKGLLLGEAKKYVIEIYKQFDEAGYIVQHFLLDASEMGVPQKRERVFFIALRKDLCTPFMVQKDMFTHAPLIELQYSEPEIPFGEIYDGTGDGITEYKQMAWECRKVGDNGISDSKAHANMKISDFNHVYLFKDRVMPTINAKGNHEMSLFDEPIKPSDNELILGGSYPQDYHFLDSKAGYLIGMSVPPVMMAHIAHDIYNQWLSKI